MSFLRSYLYLLLPSFLLTFYLSLRLGFNLGLLAVILISLVLCAVPATLIDWFSEKMGAAASILYRGPQECSSIAQYRGNITRARVLRTKGSYAEALVLIDEYLEKAPGASEALFLKAQTLLDSSGNLNQAKLCLDTIIKENSPDDPYCRWAKELRLKTHRPFQG